MQLRLVCLKLSLEYLKPHGTTSNNFQQHACDKVFKGTQHVGPKNVGCCWPTSLHLHGPEDRAI